MSEHIHQVAKKGAAARNTAMNTSQKQTKSSLLDGLETLSPSAGGGKCGIGKILRQLSPSERSRMDDAIERIRQGEPIGAALSRTLNDAGYRTSPSSLLRHARKDCLCER